MTPPIATDSELFPLTVEPNFVPVSDQLAEGGLQTGPGGSISKTGDNKSANYDPGVSGWIIKSNGDVEFNDGTFRGALAANSINIPGPLVTSTGWHVDSSGNMWWGTSGSVGAASIKITAAGAATLVGLTASSATISGTITTGNLTATGGTIGGWTIGSTTLTGGGVTLDSAGIITSATIRTAASGTRIELTPSNEIKFYNGATFVGSIFSSSTTGIGFFDSSGNLNAAVLSTNGDIALAKSGGSFLAQSGGTFGWLTHNNQIFSNGAGDLETDSAWTCPGLFPTLDDSYDMGTSSDQWQQLYVNKILGRGGANVFDMGAFSGEIVTNQTLSPSSAAGANLGNATRYWNDVSYKTLTDRGCLGWFDEGVELQDGTLVSDTEALLAIKKDPKKLTVYGKPMLDYASLPKSVYRPVDRTKEPDGVDGAETTALISIMLGAIKELAVDMKKLKEIKQ